LRSYVPWRQLIVLLALRGHGGFGSQSSLLIAAACSCTEYSRQNDNGVACWCLVLRCNSATHGNKHWHICKLCKTRVTTRLAQHNLATTSDFCESFSHGTRGWWWGSSSWWWNDRGGTKSFGQMTSPTHGCWNASTGFEQLPLTFHFWRDQLENDDGVQQLVYRAIAKVCGLWSNTIEHDEALFHLKFAMYLPLWTIEAPVTVTVYWETIGRRGQHAAILIYLVSHCIYFKSSLSLGRMRVVYGSNFRAVVMQWAKPSLSKI
jgi:hypothetical protein